MNSRINFSLTQMEYVLALHKYGHFGRAAEACQVTQPTLSMQIQKLEEQLGVVLFDRSKKPLLVTKTGEKLFEQFQTLLFEAKKIESIIEGSKDGRLSGVLQVGIIPTIAPYLLPRLLSSVEKEFPSLELQIQELQTHQIISAINEDKIDVGILATPLNVAKIFERPLYFEPFKVYCDKNHELAKHKKISNSGLRADDIWLLQEGHCLRSQVLDVCKLKARGIKHKQFSFESGSLETLKSLVEIYGGYTLLPEMAAEHISLKGRLISFERPIPAREIGLVYRREHYKIELLNALAEAILKAIPENLKNLKAKDLDLLPI